jgi:ABC-type glutathione transport system ATPase component
MLRDPMLCQQSRRRTQSTQPKSAPNAVEKSGERGSSLSGGQRQRIAIARALVSDPRILIFDEATSALDFESEWVIQENMAQIANGRTVFIVAHRLSTLRIADRVITIERGRLIEDGTHDELIRTGGRYATLYRLQAQGRLRWGPILEVLSLAAKFGCPATEIGCNKSCIARDAFTLAVHDCSA